MITEEIWIDVGELEHMWDSLLDLVENEKARVLITRNRRAIALVVPADAKFMSDQEWQQAKTERREHIREMRKSLQGAWSGDRPTTEEILQWIHEGREESYSRIERAIEESRREREQGQRDEV